MQVRRQFPSPAREAADRTRYSRRHRLARPSVRGLRVTGHAAAILVVAASLATLAAEPAPAQQEAGSDIAAQVEAAGPPAAIEETLGRIDGLIAQLDARIKDTRARAEEILDLADAATDPGEQLRLEELYGRMAALARSFEEQTSRLRALRNELAAAGDKMPP